MFPSFPHLAETIAAERAADYQRQAAAYRRARGARSATLTSRLRTRTHRGHHEVAGSMASRETCAASRAM